MEDLTALTAQSWCPIANLACSANFQFASPRRHHGNQACRWPRNFVRCCRKPADGAGRASDGPGASSDAAGSPPMLLAAQPMAAERRPMAPEPHQMVPEPRPTREKTLSMSIKIIA